MSCLSSRPWKRSDVCSRSLAVTRQSNRSSRIRISKTKNITKNSKTTMTTTDLIWINKTLERLGKALVVVVVPSLKAQQLLPYAQGVQILFSHTTIL